MTVIKSLCFCFVIAGMFCSSALADDCDAAFSGVQGFLCKLGRVEHKIGLKVDDRLECVELKPVAINGCTVEPLKTEKAKQILYIVGTKAMKESLRGFDWQCDVNGGNGRGGLEKTTFEGYLHPDYTIGKFPGESNSDRNRRFQQDMEKKGKYIVASIGIENPIDQYYKKFDNQICQYFNPKTNKVAFRFNCNVNFAGLVEEKKEERNDNAVGQGLKNLFGR